MIFYSRWSYSILLFPPFNLPVAVSLLRNIFLKSQNKTSFSHNRKQNKSLSSLNVTSFVFEWIKKEKETQALTLYFKRYSNINSQHYKTRFVTDLNVQITVYIQIANLQYSNETQNHLYIHTHQSVPIVEILFLSLSISVGMKNKTKKTPRTAQTSKETPFERDIKRKRRIQREAGYW